MKRRAGFTLVEILVVLAIISILAALLFPVFKTAQEKGYQSSCASTLSSIGVAVQQYRIEEGRYPSALAFLLPETAKLNNPATAGTPDVNTNGTGYLRLPQTSLICPDDDTDSTLPRSSYGDLSTNINNPVSPTTDMGRYVWNYWGSKDDGTAYRTPTEAAVGTWAPGVTPAPATAQLLVDPLRPYNESSIPGYPTAPVGADYGPTKSFNGVKYSMSNRFAPPTTIITHCIYHRMPTSNLAAPGEVYTDAVNGKDARDIILRVDGSAKSFAITQFQSNGNWQNQNF